MQCLHPGGARLFDILGNEGTCTESSSACRSTTICSASELPAELTTLLTGHGPLPERTTTDQLWLFRPEDCQAFPLEGSQSLTRVTATLQLEVSVLDRCVPLGCRPATPGKSRREQPLPVDVLTRDAVRGCAGAAGVARCTGLTGDRPSLGPCAPC